MKCPYCGFAENQMLDKRETGEEQVTRRRRECFSCQKRFTTYERIETIDLVVVKRDGRKEAFSTEKLKAGIIKSCEKRPITEEQVVQIVESIEGQCAQAKDNRDQKHGHRRIGRSKA